MITLEDFKNNNLKINWKVIDIGCLGSEIFNTTPIINNTKYI